MVERVYGKANDFELVMTKGDDGMWRTVVPRIESGRYVLELWAMDTAGNISYLTDAILLIDTSTLCVHLIPSDTSELIDMDFCQKIVDTEFRSEYIDEEFALEIVNDNYEFSIICPVCNVDKGVKL